MTLKSETKIVGKSFSKLSFEDDVEQLVQKSYKLNLGGMRKLIMDVRCPTFRPIVIAHEGNLLLRKPI